MGEEPDRVVGVLVELRGHRRGRLVALAEEGDAEDSGEPGGELGTDRSPARCRCRPASCTSSQDLPRYCTDSPDMPPLVHRGVRRWRRFPTFQPLCCLRCTTRSSTPLFIDSPINCRRRCMTVLDLRSRSVTACRFVRWPGMGTGHAMSDMLHDRRLRRSHLSPTTCLGSVSRGGTLQPPCLYPTRHAVVPAALFG